MIEINSVTKYYGKSTSPAVDNVTLTVEAGQIYGFLGPNGAGKSTLIKCMIGVIPFQGSIKICNRDIVTEPILAKHEIGFVPDNHVIYEKLTGREYINFICNIYRVDPIMQKNIFDKLIEMFELGRYIDSQIGTYSHGTKQKFAIIGALIHNPKVWILDEPLTGLDPKSAYTLKLLMKEHAASGNTVFFSSHVLEVVEKLCERVAIINRGKLIGEHNVDELLNKREDLSLEEYFLKLTGEAKMVTED